MAENPRSIAIVTATNSLQLHIKATDFREERLVDVGVALSRIEAQKLAHALLQYSGAVPMTKGASSRRTVVTGVFRPDFAESTVVRLGTGS